MVRSEAENKCKTCKWFNPAGAIQVPEGSCVAFPPGVNSNFGLKGVFPVVNQECYCGWWEKAGNKAVLQGVTKREYLTVDDFSHSAEHTDVTEQVKENLLKETEKEYIDDVELKKQQDWGDLANKVVGAESRDKAVLQGVK